MGSILAYMCSILRVHSNHFLCLTVPKFTDLLCSVHQELNCQKVASIWANMCNILRVHSTHLLCPTASKFNNLICSVHKEPSRQKVASIWAYMCSIYRVSINLVRPYPNILTFFVQYTKTQAVKTCLSFELFCAVYKVTLNSSPVVPGTSLNVEKNPASRQHLALSYVFDQGVPILYHQSE